MSVNTTFLMAAVCHLVFIKVRFREPLCVIMQNVVPISQKVAEIWPLFEFSRWRPSAIFDF